VVNRGFAFALTVGIITGTYSSIICAQRLLRLRDAEKAELID
jgi:preprotein translocase subunit SecF